MVLRIFSSRSVMVRWHVGGRKLSHVWCVLLVLWECSGCVPLLPGVPVGA